MSSLPTAGFSTKTIVQALRSRVFTCTHSECGRTDVSFDDARVPDLMNLYLKARGGEVKEKYPLTASELAADVRCFKHPLAEVHMWPIRFIAEEMDRWVAKNAAELDPDSRPQPRPQQREKRPSPGYVVSLLATRQPVVEKPNPSHRHRTKVPKAKRPPDAPKNYGVPLQKAPENPNKAVKGQNPKKHKKKQPGH